jgi:hypothetical protein
MFFLKEETKVITMHPSYFGPNMREFLIARLNEEEEGRCTGDHFVICVMDMVDIGEGRVVPSSGSAEYTIKYRAIIWKPFRGETVCILGGWTGVITFGTVTDRLALIRLMQLSPPSSLPVSSHWPARYRFSLREKYGLTRVSLFEERC